MKNSFDKGFRLASVEYNPGGFGLRTLTFVARDGEAWRVKASDGHIPKVGSDVRVRLNGTRNVRDWDTLGYEFAEPIHRMSKQVVRAIYS